MEVHQRLGLQFGRAGGRLGRSEQTCAIDDESMKELMLGNTAGSQRIWERWI